MMELTYRFEKVHGQQEQYQVRLAGEFVMYTDRKDPTHVDQYLKENGWGTREVFLQDCARELGRQLINGE